MKKRNQTGKVLSKLRSCGTELGFRRGLLPTQPVNDLQTKQQIEAGIFVHLVFRVFQRIRRRHYVPGLWNIITSVGRKGGSPVGDDLRGPEEAYVGL